jgi:nucleoside 2-deoxyribosyltransferase
MNIYLAGLISTEKPESLLWRDMIQSHWENNPLIEVLSPLEKKRKLADTSPDGGVTSNGLTSKDILLRDLNDIQRSDVILANLNSFGSTRPLIGTIAELAWAWRDHKPIVAISYPDDPFAYLARNHPFLSAFVTHYCDSIPAAVEHIENFWAR